MHKSLVLFIQLDLIKCFAMDIESQSTYNVITTTLFLGFGSTRKNNHGGDVWYCLH